MSVLPPVKHIFVISGQTKVISGSQAGLLAGGQFIVQQGSPSKVIGQQILSTTGKKTYLTLLLVNVISYQDYWRCISRYPPPNLEGDIN